MTAESATGINRRQARADRPPDAEPATRLTAVATLPELAFSVLGAERVEYAATPTLRFAVRVESTAGHPIRSLLLDTQIRIAAQRRRYDAGAQERLFELFGAPGQWGSTLRSLLWTQVTVVVPAFEGSREVDIPVPCTYDLEVAAARYFAALDDGEVPIELLFSGSVFYALPDGRLQTTRHLVGPRGGVPDAGARLARDDRALLPRQRVAAPQPRPVRPAGRVQGPPRAGHVGRHRGRAAGA